MFPSLGSTSPSDTLPITGHAVVIGGTGMLAGVCLALANDGRDVTVLARRSHRLLRLVALAQDLQGTIHPLSLDYADDTAFASAIHASQIRNGPFELAVCWAHGTAPRVPYTLAESLHPSAVPPHFFHILSSATADPGGQDAELRASFLRRDARYHEVILGFAVESGMSRWLTDAEIVTGVLHAIRLEIPRHVVGTVTPWDDRPTG